MPCGGIWTPDPKSHWVQGRCWVCSGTGCELFCDEWDTPLHIKCLGKFLETDEGKLAIISHGHSIVVEERLPTPQEG